MLVDVLGTVAAGKGATPAQFALGWLLTREPWIVPIPGTRRVERLEESLAASSITLTADELAGVTHAAAAIEVHGERYPEHLQRLVDR